MFNGLYAIKQEEGANRSFAFLADSGHGWRMISVPCAERVTLHGSAGTRRSGALRGLVADRRFGVPLLRHAVWHRFPLRFLGIALVSKCLEREVAA